MISMCCHDLEQEIPQHLPQHLISLICLMLMIFYFHLCWCSLNKAPLAVGMMAWLTIFFRAWFVKHCHNWRDGVIVMHCVMTWLASFSWGESWISFKFYAMHEWWKSKKTVLTHSSLTFSAYYLSCENHSDRFSYL